MIDKHLHLIGTSAGWIIRLTFAFGFGVVFGRKYPNDSREFPFLFSIVFICALTGLIVQWVARKNRAGEKQ